MSEVEAKMHMAGRTSRIAAFALIVAILALVPGHRARAHPHVFVEAKTEIVFNADGRITAIRHIWRFDAAFSAFAGQGLDEDRDGILTTDELQPLAKVNVESLQEFDFFTFLQIDGIDAEFVPPPEYWLDHSDGLLTLFFTLPLKKAAAVAGRKLILDVFDPAYFVGFEMVKDTPFTLISAPRSCIMNVSKPKQLDAKTATALAAIPREVRQLPDALQTVTEELSNTARVNCP
jgi:ABC-type uncharacterized transport system substrate-binding protein